VGVKRPTRRAFLAIAVSSAAALGCGGAAPPPPDVVSAPVPALPPPAPKPKNAHLLAQAISGGKTTALLHVDRLRAHPAGPRIAELPAFRDLFEGTGVDPIRDLDRAFVTATATNDEAHVIAVGEHNLDETRLARAMEELIAKSDPPGEWVQNLGVRAARVTIERRTRIVALPTPKLLVVLPEAHAAQAAGFADSGGLPEPTGAETLVATAIEPHKTLKMPKRFAVPATIQRGEARLVLEPGGGATVEANAVSTDPAQAKRDAAEMTDKIENATTLKVSVVKVRVFKPIEFVAEGSNVKSKVALSKDEVERLLGLAATFAPR
jgi:hypothetical protein